MRSTPGLICRRVEERQQTGRGKRRLWNQLLHRREVDLLQERERFAVRLRPLEPRANVWVTALLPDQAAPAVKLLNEAAKEFRRELSRNMKLRQVPELHFKYDDSVDKGERIDQLLRDNPVKPEGE